MRIKKTMIRLRRCDGGFEYSFGTHVRRYVLSRRAQRLTPCPAE